VINKKGVRIMATEKIYDLISNNHLGQDIQNFYKADELLKGGAALPKLKKEESSFENKSEFFRDLSYGVRDLYIALRTNPDIIKEQDENGQTILHHAAHIGLGLGSNSASLILELLFEAKGADFSIRDNNGDTPVHIAAKLCHDRSTCDFIFPNYISKASETGFDFSQLNNQGQAVLHIAARNTEYSFYVGDLMGRQRNNVETIIESVPNIDLNVLSSSGSTALFYALNHGRFYKAETLLKAGADPKCGSQDRRPEKQLKEFEEELKNNTTLEPERVKWFTESIEKIRNLIKNPSAKEKTPSSSTEVVTESWLNRVEKQKTTAESTVTLAKK
jgi:ankyrin repeat protein